MRKSFPKRIRLALMAASSLFVIGASPAFAEPVYSFLTTIAVPVSLSNSDGGSFANFDISSFDPTTQLDYVADQSNASVDIFSAATDTYVGRLGGSGNAFSGHVSIPNASGPNGVLAVDVGGQHEVFAGNGDSTLKVYNVPSNTLKASVATGPASANRVDELAFDPNTGQVLAANDAASPSPYLTLINASDNKIAKQIVLNGKNGTVNATGAIEQPIYDARTDHYYVSIPQVDGKGPGGIAELDSSGALTHFFDFGSISGGSVTACGPTGLAVSTGGQMVVGCGSLSQTIIFNPSGNGGAGSLKLFKQVVLSDQVAYDAKNNLFFVPGLSNHFTGVLDLIDASTDAFVQSLAITPIDHSIAVYPISGQVFVPFGGVPGNGVCKSGCIGVFAPNATSVPEPGSLALLLSGVAGLALVTARRRHSLRRPVAVV